MAYLFGDSFDFYSAATDAGQGYWDTAVSNAILLVPGRFAGSQAIANSAVSSGLQLGKSSGSNDATVHVVCGFEQLAATTGTTLIEYIQLLDGTTGQCCIVFRSDGAILLTSGTPAGTVLATYTGAFSANVWMAFEFEITINNTTGAFHVRANGATSDSFVATGLNTRVSANNFANKLQIGSQSSATSQSQKIDDLLWFNTTGAAPNTWVGDIRAYQLMPNGVASQQFSPSPNPAVASLFPTATTISRATGIAQYIPFTAAFTGTLGSFTVSINTGGTGNLKGALYDAIRTTVLATSNAVVNPATGINTLTFASPPSVVRGGVYYVAVDQDTTLIYNGANSGAGFSSTTAYASFPATAPSTTTVSITPTITVSIAPTVNSELVSEAQEDGVATYVFDSTVGQADFYSIAPLPLTPTSIVAVTTRGFVAKSDAGTRAAQMQLKSGATTVQSAALALSTSFLWNSRTDTVDPNTSAAWTAPGVNAIQIGPLVQA